MTHRSLQSLYRAPLKTSTRTEVRVLEVRVEVPYRCRGGQRYQTITSTSTSAIIIIIIIIIITFLRVAVTTLSGGTKPVFFRGGTTITPG